MPAEPGSFFNGLAILLAALLITGCQTPPLPRPIDAEALGMLPNLKPTPAAAAMLQQDAIAAFTAIFGEPLPASFALSGPTTGWFNNKGELKQIRAAAKISRAEFRAKTASKGWQEIPVPPEHLKVMHLPANVPKNYMTCFVGQVRGKPAFLFWSDYTEATMLFLDY